MHLFCDQSLHSASDQRRTCTIELQWIRIHFMLHMHTVVVRDLFLKAS